jgi:hypothetical protein
VYKRYCSNEYTYKNRRTVRCIVFYSVRVELKNSSEHFFPELIFICLDQWQLSCPASRATTIFKDDIKSYTKSFCHVYEFLKEKIVKLKCYITLNVLIVTQCLQFYEVREH